MEAPNFPNQHPLTDAFAHGHEWPDVPDIDPCARYSVPGVYIARIMARPYGALYGRVADYQGPVVA